MRFRRSFLLALALTGASVAGGLAGSAHASSASASACPPGTSPSYPPGQCRLEVDPVTAEVGATVTIGGCGFGKGERVKLDLVPVGDLTSLTLTAKMAADDGCVRAKVTLAATVGGVVTLPAPGPYALKAVGLDSAGEEYELVSDTLTLTAGATGAATIGGSLAANGAGEDRSSGWVAVVGVLLVVGGLVLSLRWRRSDG